MPAPIASPLHAAALALVPSAPARLIRQILRLLLASDSDAAESAPAPAPVASRPGRPKATQVNNDWDSLRQRVRAEMQRRGWSFADLASAVGRSEATIRIRLTSRSAPGRTIASLLEKWLDAVLVKKCAARLCAGPNTHCYLQASSNLFQTADTAPP
jgi:hypothetical protein